MSESQSGQRKRKDIGVIAVGNELMGDDGIGPAVLDALKREQLPRSVDLIHGGTGGVSLLHLMKDYSTVIFIDSAEFGGDPGKIKVFTPSDVASTKEVTGLSLHETDLIKVIRLSQELGEAPETIVIVAVQPKQITMKDSLSPEVASAVPCAVRKVLSQIEGAG